MQDTEFEVLVKPCAEHLYAAPVLFDGNTVAVTGELSPFVVISYFVCGEVGIILDVFHSDGEGCPCTFQGKRSLYPGTEFFVQVVVPPSKLRMIVAHVETRIQVLDECPGCQLYGIFKQPEIQVGPAFHIELPDIFSEQRHFACHIVVQGFSFPFAQLSAYRDIIFRIAPDDFVSAVQVRHGIMTVFVRRESCKAGFRPFVETFAQGYAQSVLDGVTPRAVTHIVGVSIKQVGIIVVGRIV